MSDVSALVIVFGLALALSGILTISILWYARRMHLLDQPGRRRSHSVPTPRGGGVSFVLVQLGFIAWAVAQGFAWTGMLLGLAGIAVVGFADDHRPMSASVRLFVHVLGAALTLLLLESPPASAVWFALSMLWIVAMTNAWNFMDGINGLASFNAMLGFVAYALLAFLDGRPEVVVLAVVAAGATTGFVPFNFPRAKIFMGDVGSGSLGFLLAAIAVLLWTGDSAGIVLLFPVFSMVADAGLTLASRVGRGRRWYAPHREHLYQWLVRSGYSHAQVVLGFVAFNVLIVLPHMLIARTYPALSIFALFSAIALATVLWVGGKRYCLSRIRCLKT
ncbi:MAG: glycosyltransferase family 4 protein [Lysobacteraceae bacterium]